MDSKQFYRVKMKFIQQSRSCAATQAVRLLEILKGVHEQGFAHGDTRESNLLLIKSAYLIDFDVTG